MTVSWWCFFAIRRGLLRFIDRYEFLQGFHGNTNCCFCSASCSARVIFVIGGQNDLAHTGLRRNSFFHTKKCNSFSMLIHLTFWKAIVETSHHRYRGAPCQSWMLAVVMGQSNTSRTSRENIPFLPWYSAFKLVYKYDACKKFVLRCHDYMPLNECAFSTGKIAKTIIPVLYKHLKKVNFGSLLGSLTTVESPVSLCKHQCHFLSHH